jgi:heme/copper-type cytochrome/quinol oxidase subunit 4
MGGLFYLLTIVLTAYPMWQLCPKYRLPNWFALVVIIPFGAIELLWIFVYRDKIQIPGVDK